MAHTVSVREVMSEAYLGVHEGETVEAVASALTEHREDTAIVLDGHRPIGTVRAVDLLDAVFDDADTAPVGEFLRAPVATIEPDATLQHAIERLAVTDADGLVVVDRSSEAVGIVDARDLLTGASGLLDDHLEVAVHDAASRTPPSMSEQGVCEACGRLTDELHESDGTLLCAACAEL